LRFGAVGNEQCRRRSAGGALSGHRFDAFESILADILSSEQSVRSLVDDRVTMAILDGLVRNGDEDRVHSVWSQLIRCGVEPNSNCYGTAILAMSKMSDRRRAERAVSDNVAALKRVHCYDGHRLWHQILLAHSNLGRFDKMWADYDGMKGLLTPNEVTFSILAHRGDGEGAARRALEEATRCGLKWTECSHRALKGFWRAAARGGDLEFMAQIKPILDAKQQKIAVTALLEASGAALDGETLRFENFYDGEKDRAVLRSVDELIRRCGHRVDVGQHPELDTNSALKFIAYHAEKKALAHALSKGAQSVTIRLSLRMCPDCHSFFRSVSRMPEYAALDITVFDGNAKHSFRGGECSCAAARFLNAQ